MKLVLKIVAGIAGLIAVGLGGVFAYVMTLDVKQEIQQRVESATGRSLAIEGPLEFELGFQTRLSATDITLSNASWGSRPNMLELAAIDIELDLLSLLGTPDITRFRVEGLRGIVETNAEGVSNTDFSDAPGAADSHQSNGEASGGGGSGALVLPILRDVSVTDVELVQKDGVTGEQTVFTLNELVLGARSEADPLQLTLDALLVATAAPDPLGILLVGEMGSLESMTNSDIPTPLDLTGNVAGIDLSIGGEIQDLAGQDGFNITISAFGDELAEAAAVLGIDVPGLGGFKVDATLAGSGSDLAVNPLSIDVGGEDVIRATVDGTIANVMAQEGIDLNITVKSTQIGNLNPITQAFGIPAVPAFGPLDISVGLSGGIEDGLAAQDLSLALGTPDMLTLSVTGNVADLATQDGIDLTIAANSSELGALSDITEQISGRKVPDIGPMTLNAMITGGIEDRLSMSDLAVSIGRAETVSFEASGDMSDILNASGADIGFRLISPNLSALSGFVGADVPPIGPVDVSGTVKGAAGEPIILDPFNAVIASSDLSGTATFDATGAVPLLTATLSSDRFDLNDVTGGDSGGGSSGGGTSGESSGGAGGASDGRVIPADPLPFDLLNAFNADISYTANTFVAVVSELSDFEITIKLKDGKLDVGPFSGAVGEGSLNGTLALDGSQETAPLSLTIDGKGMGLDSLLAGAGFRDRIQGPIDLSVALAGAGNSPRAIAASMNGTVATSMYGSKILRQALEEAGGSLVANMLSEDGGWIVIDCAVFDYGVTQGVMNTRAGYLASGPVSAFSEGDINLGTEELSLEVKPSGAGGIASVALLVDGTLASPSITPDPVAIGVGVLAGVLTGGLAPALMATIGDLPSGHPCKAASERTQAQAEEAARSQPIETPNIEQILEQPEAVLDAIDEGIGDTLNNLFGN